ncbi:GtrA family protein [Hyphomonas sp.]|uniref:GtrA family protein n=1 Tax=Hyphomonas sp. TaxID=87 RepID=UPI00391AEB03
MSAPEKPEADPQADPSGLVVKGFFGEVSRFTVVGILATVTYFLVANALILLVQAEPRLASVSAYLAGMAVSFFGQSRFTFKIDSTRFGHVWRFVILSALGLSVSYFSVPLAQDVLGLHPSWATVITMVLVPLLSFILMKFWVFAGRH